MSNRKLEIWSQGRLNFIPSGRQLPRTPPLTDVRKHLDFCNEDWEETQQSVQVDGTRMTSMQNTMCEYDSLAVRTETDDPTSMLRGMTGYQLTPCDLEFIKKMKDEKLVRKLQGELEEIQKLLNKETMAYELICEVREKAEAVMREYPSCKDLVEWMKMVIKSKAPLTDLMDLDAKALLTMLTEKDVQTAVDEKRIELRQLETQVANKKKKEAEERGQLEKQVAGERMRIQSLMSQLSILKSELAQQEEANKTLEIQISNLKAQQSKLEAKEAKTSEEPQATKVKSRGKERKKANISTENSKDLDKQRKSTKSKLAEEKGNKQRDRKQAAAVEEQNAGLRRSKRIASRKL
ncbi:uncharacterized protein LOC121506495 [Cheilinus undulatus]|uniref:uncharacterized protein LOC121506495 n=1 Tax=Cheilinus undulatus TaxID=241271 RepID=UPI001BD33301|nr:uncharacterized protein LOC121506495 [Cheilinus undulatus]